MAKKTSAPSDSNTGLIVTLVLFVVATLTLGVFTYLGYSGQTELVEKEKKAQGEVKAAKKALDEETLRRLIIAIATGNEQPGDQQRLNGLKNNYKGEFDKTVASLKDLDKWDANLDRPALTYADKFAKMNKDLSIANNEKKQAEQKRDEAEKAFASERTTFNDNQAKAKQLLEDTQNKALKDLSDRRDDYAKLIDKLDKELSEGLKNEKQGRADDNSAAEREKKQLRSEIASKIEQLDRIKSLVAPPNSLEADTPKGSIIRVDRVAKTVFINLGSADYLKPQVTFSVWGAGTSGRTTANRDPKGRVEVVNILEPHLSVARIVSTNNEFRDPILTGDLLFNPSWNSSQREHIALSGIFDLDGDGHDDTPELVRNLERQGIVVDAWVDLRDRTIKGPGITERTAFLVVGERPELSDTMKRQVAQLGENPLVQAFTQINSQLVKMEEMAQQKGVQKVSYRRYLTLVGYPMPKLTKPLDLTASSYVRQATAAIVGTDTGASPSNGAEAKDKSKEDKPKTTPPKAEPKDDKPKEDMPKEDKPKEEKKDE
jgi:hypothetical protein